MPHDRGFDEVMIVNPYDPRVHQPATIQTMRFHESPDMGYYAAPPEMGYYAEPPDYGYYGEPPELGWYAEPPEPYGWYAEPPEMGYYGEPPELSGYAELPEPYGWYAEPPELGYYAEYPELGYYGYGGYAEPPELAYYAEPPELSGYGCGYGQMPEMVGYQEYEPLAEEYPGVADYGEPELSGYVRQRRPTYNPGCPMPTNVAGLGETPPIEGYVRPGTVNPTCDQLAPQPDSTSRVPDTFRPLW